MRPRCGRDGGAVEHTRVRRQHASLNRRRLRWASRRSSAETPSRRRQGTKRRPTAAAEKCSHKRGDGREVAHDVAGGNNSGSPMDCPPTASGSGGRSYRGHLSRVASRAGAGRRSRWREGGAGCSGAPRAAASNSRVEWRASSGSRGRDRGWLGEYCVYAPGRRRIERAAEGGVSSATPAAFSLSSLCPT